LKKIIYTPHLKFRLEKRGIRPDIPREIYQYSDEKYYDIATGHKIAISRLHYSGREREVMIAYDEFEERIEIVTVHLSNGLKSNTGLKPRGGQKYEKQK